MSRVLVPSAIVLATACSGTPPRPRPRPLPTPAPTQTARPTPAPAAKLGPLPPASAFVPAGVGFRPPALAPARPASLCVVLGLECPRPTVVVVAGIVADGEQASLALTSLEAGSLPPGYPYAAHTDQLGLVGAPDGVAIVMGAFEDAAVPRQWLPENAEPRSYALAAQTMAQRFVVEITAADAVPAYARNDLVFGIEHATGEPSKKPVCHAPARSVFVVSSQQISAGFGQWAPVWCGSEVAYVAREHTGLDAVYVVETERRFVRNQLLGYECNLPIRAERAFERGSDGWVKLARQTTRGCGR